MSYASGGKQYVATISGFVGGYYNQMAPDIGGGNPTITVFALNRNAGIASTSAAVLWLTEGSDTKYPHKSGAGTLTPRYFRAVNLNG